MIALTGTNGNVGGRVARLLSAAGIRARLIGRDPAVIPDLAHSTKAPAAHYGDGDAMRVALDGVNTLFLVSGRGHAERMEQHRTTLDAAADAGVQRIVYLSFFGAASDSAFSHGHEHWQTEELVKASGVRHTFLRDNFYASLLASFAAADGVIRGPAGEGRVSAVSHDDVARAVAAVLTDVAEGGTRHDGRTYDLTGPEALSMDDAAGILSALSGRPVRYERETAEEAYSSRAVYDAPAWQLDGWVTSYLAIAAGQADAVSPHVEELTGRPAETVEQFLRRNPQTWAHLLPA